MIKLLWRFAGFDSSILKDDTEKYRATGVALILLIYFLVALFSFVGAGFLLFNDPWFASFIGIIYAVIFYNIYLFVLVNKSDFKYRSQVLFEINIFQACLVGVFVLFQVIVVINLFMITLYYTFNPNPDNGLLIILYKVTEFNFYYLIICILVFFFLIPFLTKYVHINIKIREFYKISIENCSYFECYEREKSKIEEEIIFENHKRFLKVYNEELNRFDVKKIKETVGKYKPYFHYLDFSYYETRVDAPFDNSIISNRVLPEDYSDFSEIIN